MPPMVPVAARRTHTERSDRRTFKFLSDEAPVTGRYVISPWERGKGA